ncbi:MAG TPA: ribosome small subunit-dependent GTPase A [Woeseiaceae bacterium]|nr:ribosome small subunit-dependent GTPase A [Woeseiaceae bacterium]
MTDLQALGWRNFFAAQLDEAADGALAPARVMAVHRGRLELDGEQVTGSVLLPKPIALGGPAVGDWVLVEPQGRRVCRVLERAGVFRRRAAGEASKMQALAANVDTVFVVTSANRDFNVARLERYLALAHDAAAWPVVVITKADQVASTDEFAAAARRLAPGLVVESLDARDPAAMVRLLPWCGPGQTVALLGSSGVGKSTLVNSLAGAGLATHAARPQDQRGRHTTTARSMHRLPAGGWLIDTPGMRELRLAGVGDALDDVFTEIATLAAACRFGDCRHDSEPGCAVRAAIESGALDAGRLARYHKLCAEDARNSASVAERRQRERALGRSYRDVLTAQRRMKQGERE